MSKHAHIFILILHVSLWTHKHAKVWKTDLVLCYLQYWCCWNTNTEMQLGQWLFCYVSGVQCYINHFELWENSSHGPEIVEIFLYVYMKFLNCGTKDMGSVQDDTFCGWNLLPLLSKGKSEFAMGIKLYYLSLHLPCWY